MSGQYEVKGHAFISYASEDSPAAQRLQAVLQAAGVAVWRDSDSLWPGQDWRSRIRQAITDDALVFIACFSKSSTSRPKSYQNEELTLAIEQLRLRRPEDPWLIPVRFDDCSIPDLEIGPGRTLNSIQRMDFFGDNLNENIARLVSVVLRILYRNNVTAGLVAPQRRSAVTDRWRLTRQVADVPAMGDLGTYRFSHQGYRRSAERTPPWVRVRAVVAAQPLGDTQGWQSLREKFLGLLTQAPVADLVGELSELRPGATWRPSGTLRRSSLEADFSAGHGALAPIASASLILPELQDFSGLRSGYSLLTLHIDFARRRPVTISGQLTYKRPPYWRDRFAQAIALPGDLASWLQSQLGLETSGALATQFGIVLRDTIPLTDMIDTKGISALSTPVVPDEFT